MYDFLAYCAECNEFTGVNEGCLDTRRQRIFIKLDCEHTITIPSVMILQTKREFQERYPEEEEDY